MIFLRKPMIAGNWKMNTTVQEGLNTVSEIIDFLAMENNELVDTLICPPFITIKKVHEILDGQLLLGSQNVFWEEKGSFTGEISPLMLKGLADYVIIGHSERRQYFNETNQMINKKIKACLNNNLKPIVCVGESLEVREQGKEKEFINKQLEEGFDSILESDVNEIVLAYEPIWAIGTGKAASPKEAQEIISQIRDFLKKNFSENLASKTRILYGGSSSPDNIESFMLENDIDGALVGAVSLKPMQFTDMVKKTIALAKK